MILIPMPSFSEVIRIFLPPYQRDVDLTERVTSPFTLQLFPSGRTITMSKTVPENWGCVVRIKKPVRDKSLDVPLNRTLETVNSILQRLMKRLLLRFDRTIITDKSITL